LSKEPQIVMEALQAFQTHQQEQRRLEQTKNLPAILKSIDADKRMPVIGNLKGDVTIYEFFDYMCGYCRLMFPKVREFLEKDGKVRLVLLEFPVLSEVSHKASKFALAANKQGKYKDVHNAFMEFEGQLTAEAIDDILSKVKGLDMARLKKDAESKEIQDILDTVRSWAQATGTQGVPQFIIGDYISNGAMMGTELQDNVARIRAAAAKK